MSYGVNPEKFWKGGFMEEEDGLMFNVYKQRGRGREFRL